MRLVKETVHTILSRFISVAVYHRYGEKQFYLIKQ